MVDDGKNSGEDGGASKGPCNCVQCGHPGSAPVWEKNSGFHRRDDKGNVRFHHRITRGVAGMTVQSIAVGEWKWALLESALEATWIWTIREYMQRQQAMCANYVVNRHI